MWSGDSFTLYAKEEQPQIDVNGDIVKDTNGNTIYEPCDLTGAIIKWGLKKTVNSLEILVTKTIGSGITVTDAVNGKYTIKLEPDDTKPLKADTYYHECEITDNSGNVSTSFIGFVKINPSGI